MSRLPMRPAVRVRRLGAWDNLSPGTEYVLQASFDDTFPDDATKEHTFTTEPPPSIQSVSADNITKTTARAVVNIADHDGTALIVKLRYQQKADTQDWTTDVETADATSSTSPATRSLDNLSPGTEYVLQASFDDTFPDDAGLRSIHSRRILPPVYSRSVLATSGRLLRKLPSTSPTRTAPHRPQSCSIGPRVRRANGALPALEETSTGATAQIDLSGLSADTDYEVQAWLAGDESRQED